MSNANPYSPAARGTPRGADRRQARSLDPTARENVQLRQLVEDHAQNNRQHEAKEKLSQVGLALLGATAKTAVPYVPEGEVRNKLEGKSQITIELSRSSTDLFSAMVNAVDTLYTMQGYAADREISQGEEKILMRLSWPAIEALLGEHFPRASTETTQQQQVPANTACVFASNESSNPRARNDIFGTTQQQHIPADTTRVFATRESSNLSRAHNDIFVRTSPSPSETVDGDRSPGHETRHQSADPMTEERFGDNDSPWRRDSRTQMGRDGYFTQAPTPLAGFERPNTNRGTKIPVPTTPAPRVQPTTAYGRSFAPPPTGSNQAGPSLSRVAGRGPALQDPTEQRRKKEEDEELVFYKSMGLL
ncbi:hypothetical protein KC336_g5752 [Hortaea werneckii]|nr:hypothetical protein KC336_g5752 [Hortaea werneckii]